MSTNKTQPCVCVCVRACKRQTACGWQHLPTSAHAQLSSCHRCKRANASVPTRAHQCKRSALKPSQMLAAQSGRPALTICTESWIQHIVQLIRLTD